MKFHNNSLLYCYIFPVKQKEKSYPNEGYGYTVFFPEARGTAFEKNSYKMNSCRSLTFGACALLTGHYLIAIPRIGGLPGEFVKLKQKLGISDMKFQSPPTESSANQYIWTNLLYKYTKSTIKTRIKIYFQSQIVINMEQFLPLRAISKRCDI